MSTNVTITYNDISSLKSDLEVIKGKLGRGAAVFQKKTGSSSEKTINDVSFVLLETTATIKKGETSAKILTPSTANSKFLQGLQSSYFIVLSDVKSTEEDKGFYSSALYKSIKNAGDLGTSNFAIGEVSRNAAPSKDVEVTIDILFISLNP